jgi:hypothetical protein
MAETASPSDQSINVDKIAGHVRATLRVAASAHEPFTVSEWLGFAMSLNLTILMMLAERNLEYVRDTMREHADYLRQLADCASFEDMDRHADEHTRAEMFRAQKAPTVG